MFDIAIGSLLVFVASQVGTPGPANMALLATGAAYGFRRAVPFMVGVLLGKQLIIWPIGLGLMQLANANPTLFTLLKYASAAYMIWLAWRIAHLKLKPGTVEKVPGFTAGLIVHPLNPKAWAMITAGFTNFVPPETSPLTGTAVIAASLFLAQLLLHPIWTASGEKIARAVATKPAERYLMWVLASLTVASVLLVLIRT